MPISRQSRADIRHSRLAFIGAGLGIATIFWIDIETPSDNVSVCFAYALPILLAVYAGERSAYVVAIATTIASIAGSLLQPPTPETTIVFIANRAIAIGAQWLVAILIEQRRRARLMLESHLEQATRRSDRDRRLVKILSHELGSALTLIGGQSYRLAKLAASIQPTDIVVRTRKVSEAVERLKALTTRLQLASDVEEGEIAMHVTALDVSDLFQAVRSERDGEDVHWTLDVSRPIIHGDVMLLHQVLSNLVANAIKFSAGTANVTLTCRDAEPGGFMIAVADRGTGVSRDEQARIWDLYYRGTNSVGVEGAGIGLHLVRHFTELHGGAVTFESREGRGTTVTLTFPRRAAP